MPGPVWVIVVAAGQGTRFGAPKQYAPMAGARVVDWSVRAARSVADGVVLVVPPERPGESGESEGAVDAVVSGGATRSDSVRAGLTAVPEDAAVVLVHDGARPLASASLFAAVLEAVRDGADAVVPGIEVVDSLRWRDGAAVDRARLVAVQTPQGFEAGILRRAHEGGADASDDATLVESIGGRVVVVPGENANRKITDPADLAVAESLLLGSSPTTGEER